MQPSVKDSNGAYTFKTSIVYHTSGERGLSGRVLPHNEDLPTPIQPGLIVWANA